MMLTGKRRYRVEGKLLVLQVQQRELSYPTWRDARIEDLTVHEQKAAHDEDQR